MADRKRVLSFFTLFTSAGTLICCALPALFVSLGMGAVVAGLASNVPGLVWLSENKLIVFGAAGLMLVINGGVMWASRNAPCPVDPELRDACLSGRRLSRNLLLLSASVFGVGAFFAFVAPILF